MIFLILPWLVKQANIHIIGQLHCKTVAPQLNLCGLVCIMHFVSQRNNLAEFYRMCYLCHNYESTFHT
jgi:hypothetical protein